MPPGAVESKPAASYFHAAFEAPARPIRTLTDHDDDIAQAAARCAVWTPHARSASPPPASPRPPPPPHTPGGGAPRVSVAPAKSGVPAPRGMVTLAPCDPLPRPPVAPSALLVQGAPPPPPPPASDGPSAVPSAMTQTSCRIDFDAYAIRPHAATPPAGDTAGHACCPDKLAALCATQAGSLAAALPPPPAQILTDARPDCVSVVSCETTAPQGFVNGELTADGGAPAPPPSEAASPSESLRRASAALRCLIPQYDAMAAAVAAACAHRDLERAAVAAGESAFPASSAAAGDVGEAAPGTGRCQDGAGASPEAALQQPSDAHLEHGDGVQMSSTAPRVNTFEREPLPILKRPVRSGGANSARRPALRPPRDAGEATNGAPPRSPPRGPRSASPPPGGADPEAVPSPSEAVPSPNEAARLGLKVCAACVRAIPLAHFYCRQRHSPFCQTCRAQALSLGVKLKVLRGKFEAKSLEPEPVVLDDAGAERDDLMATGDDADGDAPGGAVDDGAHVETPTPARAAHSDHIDAKGEDGEPLRLKACQVCLRELPTPHFFRKLRHSRFCRTCREQSQRQHVSCIDMRLRAATGDLALDALLRRDDGSWADADDDDAPPDGPPAGAAAPPSPSEGGPPPPDAPASEDRFDAFARTRASREELGLSGVKTEAVEAPRTPGGGGQGLFKTCRTCRRQQAAAQFFCRARHSQNCKTCRVQSERLGITVTQLRDKADSGAVALDELPDDPPASADGARCEESPRDGEAGGLRTCCVCDLPLSGAAPSVCGVCQAQAARLGTDARELRRCHESGALPLDSVGGDADLPSRKRASLAEADHAPEGRPRQRADDAENGVAAGVQALPTAAPSQRGKRGNDGGAASEPPAKRARDQSSASEGPAAPPAAAAPPVLGRPAAAPVASDAAARGGGAAPLLPGVRAGTPPLLQAMFSPAAAAAALGGSRGALSAAAPSMHTWQQASFLVAHLAKGGRSRAPSLAAPLAHVPAPAAARQQHPTTTPPGAPAAPVWGVPMVVVKPPAAGGTAAAAAQPPSAGVPSSIAQARAPQPGPTQHAAAGFPVAAPSRVQPAQPPPSLASAPLARVNSAPATAVAAAPGAPLLATNVAAGVVVKAENAPQPVAATAPPTNPGGGAPPAAGGGSTGRLLEMLAAAKSTQEVQTILQLNATHPHLFA